MWWELGIPHHPLGSRCDSEGRKTRAQKLKTCCKRLDLCRSALVRPVVAEPWPIAEGSLGPWKLCLEGILAPLLACWLEFLAESSLSVMVQTSVGKLAPPEMAAIRSKVTIVTCTAYFSSWSKLCLELTSFSPSYQRGFVKEKVPQHSLLLGIWKPCPCLYSLLSPFLIWVPESETHGIPAWQTPIQPLTWQLMQVSRQIPKTPNDPSSS